MERSKLRAFVFPATTHQIPARFGRPKAGELSGSDPSAGSWSFWPEPVLRTHALHLRTDWSDRTQGSPKCGIVGGDKIEVEGEIGTSREGPVACSPRKILKIYNT